MKVLVTGISGQLGYDMANELAGRKTTEIVGTGLSEAYHGRDDGSAASKAEYIRMDLKNPEMIVETLATVRPDVVFLGAGWTMVDAAELPENREAVYATNVTAVQTIAEYCGRQGITLMYISTDYVFDGTGDHARTEDEEPGHPVNVYGETKLLAERIVRKYCKNSFVVRISWVFGCNGNNFVKTMLELAKTHSEVRVVCDQIGRPTYTGHLARLLADMLETDRYGTYHATNEGEFVSWYGFCREIYRQAGVPAKVIPVTTEEYGRKGAKRPENSRLDCGKLRKAGFQPLPDWKRAITDFLNRVKETSET